MNTGYDTCGCYSNQFDPPDHHYYPNSGYPNSGSRPGHHSTTGQHGIRAARSHHHKEAGTLTKQRTELHHDHDREYQQLSPRVYSRDCCCQTGQVYINPRHPMNNTDQLINFCYTATAYGDKTPGCPQFEMEATAASCSPPHQRQDHAQVIQKPGRPANTQYVRQDVRQAAKCPASTQSLQSELTMRVRTFAGHESHFPAPMNQGNEKSHSYKQAEFIVELARANFTYTGPGDAVRCNSCPSPNKSFNKWQPNDIPIIEHARYSPCCLFVEKTLGRDLAQEISDILGQKIDVSGQNPYGYMDKYSETQAYKDCMKLQENDKSGREKVKTAFQAWHYAFGKNNERTPHKQAILTQLTCPNNLASAREKSERESSHISEAIKKLDQAVPPATKQQEVESGTADKAEQKQSTAKKTDAEYARELFEKLNLLQ